MVFAVDFDGTICEIAYPDIGKPKSRVIERLKELKRQGHKLILNTCREGELLQNAVDWCSSYGLTFDTHNENLPEIIALYGKDCKKISADFYIDDKNLFMEGVNGN